MSSIYDWSLVAAENARADEIINWAEGQPPSSVNDSARAMMQRVKEYLSDIGGTVEVKFTKTAEEEENKNKTSIHLTTKVPYAAYQNGIVLRFKAQETNVGATSVVLNQLSSQLIYKGTQEGLKPLTGGEMQKGGLYELIYYSGIGEENREGWYLTNPTVIIPKIDVFPSGFIACFAMEKIPIGWLLCDGKAYAREEYASLFEAIGEVWGKGDEKTTFNVPDFRGMFLRGLDSERGIDKGRVLGSQQRDSFESHTHTGKTDKAGKHRHLYRTAQPVSDIKGGGGLLRYRTPESRYTDSEGEHTHEIILDRTGEHETRPKNMAVIYAIKV
ncbi:putative phage protein [Bartonella clarridgeiae 73]|uniref:Putative phage protein n=1 Tax=Bartonella clarridgeiae (strain CCUG 45776 / CIP 104772 / 73) TaxID=696125 RepID=E6YJ05_BARC7|nr:phage tail protein [Bartonella clarridgeiae]WCR55929.1 MAG: Phage protein [Bartonella clarridgeiae]CBI76843.1 putative phage protein [Bartonella clarridgeiae 73]